MNIIQLLQLQALKNPDASAIIEPIGWGKDRIATFATLEETSARGAALLKKCGLRAGDAVLVFQPMSIDLYTVLLALFRSGMTAMFLDPSAGRQHLDRCCTILQPKGLIASPKAHLLRLISSSLRRIPHSLTFGRGMPGALSWRSLEKLTPLREDISCHPDLPALITFTSGSTGIPKGVVRSHGFLHEQHRVLERTLSLKPGEKDLTTLPVFVLANLASGVTSILPEADLRRPGFIDPLPVLQQIERLTPTRIVASPALLECLCIGSSKTGCNIGGFKQVFTGGAPVFPNALRLFKEVFKGAEIIAIYGATEAEPIAAIRYREITEPDMSNMVGGGGLLTGTPVSGIQVRILDARADIPPEPLTSTQFDRWCLPELKTGEIVVSGGHVIKGYLQGHGDRETKIRVDGQVWHRTGDSGYLDHAGRLWLMGRTSAVIHDRRGTLYPFAVECAAMQHRGVRRAALVGHGTKRFLFLEPVGRITSLVEKEILEALSWASIDKVRCINHIPLDKRHNAKVDYPRLLRSVMKTRDFQG